MNETHNKSLRQITGCRIEATCEGVVSAARNSVTITLEPDTGLSVYNISAGQPSIVSV